MITDNEYYYWSTDEFHADNSETMCDFLECELGGSYSVDFVDGSYAEIIDRNGVMWEVHVSGNGDSNNHKVQFVCLGRG